MCCKNLLKIKLQPRHQPPKAGVVLFSVSLWAKAPHASECSTTEEKVHGQVHPGGLAQGSEEDEKKARGAMHALLHASSRRKHARQKKM